MMAVINDGHMTNTLSFGYWVQQRRKALDFTRPALARRVNCSVSTIKKIERDERRPSRQIAVLLADHLLVPEQERERFIAMARGEYRADPLASPAIVSLPPFLYPPAEYNEYKPAPLVARQRESEQLDSHLRKAVDGHGGIVFITGEAGSGKTMLVQHFARSSQETYSDLQVATGNCNAYTGIGDPYLPFREILELLTGDIAARWDASVMSRTTAERLWHLVPHTVQALLDVGPDLVDTFLLGSPLLTRAKAAATAQSESQIERLRSLLDQHESRHPAAHLQQSNLFAQYTRVLQELSHREPLLLIIDDLQWIDVGSVSLLFHLCRHLRTQRILVVGLYRPAEVAVGRRGERHPLEPLINELQRTFGEIHVPLNQTEGRYFVDVLVDSEPNQLNRAFRDALYSQTAGHPFFTVEMLRSLQARTDLKKNESGEWVASPGLDWNIIPARVEGILKERIGRLSSLQQKALQIASVAGETFCGEVVAHICDGDEQKVFDELSATLAREENLIRPQGVQSVGAHHLSMYGFRHILFQQYLYNSLDPIQRVNFHGAIANELEAHYNGDTKLFALKLARHYTIAGNHEQALHYYMIAGDTAAALYANAEAEAHYRSAISLVTERREGGEEWPYDKLLQLYRKLGRILELSSHHDEALVVYEEMAQIGRQQNCRTMELSSLLARAAIRATVNFARNPAEGRALLEEAHGLAHALQDRAAEAKILWNLLILSAYTGDDPHQRLRLGEEALTLARKLKEPEQLAFTLHDIFYAYAGVGQWAEARSALYEARDLWQKLDNLPMLSEALMRLHWAYLVTGDYDQATELAEEAYRLGMESHNVDAQALSHFMVGFIHWERGEIEQAISIMEDDLAIAETVNSLTPLVGTRADLALLYGELGDVARGLALAEQARQVAEEQLPILVFWPHAVQVLLHLQQGDLPTAEELSSALVDYRIVRDRFGYMPFMWIRVGLAQGAILLAQDKYEKAAFLASELFADLDKIGIWYLRPDVLYLNAQALNGQGKTFQKQAEDMLEQARTAAEELGSRRILSKIPD